MSTLITTSIILSVCVCVYTEVRSIGSSASLGSTIWSNENEKKFLLFHCSLLFTKYIVKWCYEGQIQLYLLLTCHLCFGHVFAFIFWQIHIHTHIQVYTYTSIYIHSLSHLSPSPSFLPFPHSCLLVKKQYKSLWKILIKKDFNIQSIFLDLLGGHKQRYRYIGLWLCTRGLQKFNGYCTLSCNPIFS